MAEEYEEALWESFDPMREHFENPVENSYGTGSVGSTLPKRLLSYTKQNSQQATEIKLFVSRIPTHVTESGLRNIFSLYGNVLFVHIVKQGKKDRHSSSQIGFVSLSSIIEADRAIQSLNNAPPYYLHLEFECSQEERNEKLLIENVTYNFDRISNLNLSDGDDKSQLEGDYSITEKIFYSPGIPLENIVLSLLPSSVDTLNPYHMYEGRPESEELYEPYLVWESSDSGVMSEDVSHRIALKEYIPSLDAGDIITDVSTESSSSSVSNKTTLVTIDPSDSVKKLGVLGARPSHSCAYCRRRVFISSPHMCRCGVMYDDILCQHKDWPQHKLVCSTRTYPNEDAKRNVNENVRSNKEEENEFDKVVQGFKELYSIGGTVLDNKLLNNSGVNIIPGPWCDTNSGLVTVINEVLAQDLYAVNKSIEKLPEATDRNVQIGQLVGVFLDRLELYVRGIVACKTRRGLIGVLVLEYNSFVLSPFVKIIPPLNQYRQGVCNVHCTVISQDDNLKKKKDLLYSRLKNSNKFRAFDSDYNSCTIELNPYLPSPEDVPLPCVYIENNSKVILTACHSAQALYIQPMDMQAQIRCTVLASEINEWCTKNHQQSNVDWVPKKSQMIGVRQPDGEYRRGQVIGTVTPKKTKMVIEEENDSIDKSTDLKSHVEKKYYLVSLIDTGKNMKVSSDNLVVLPNHLKRDPCYCTKISLKNSNIRLNPECFIYLNMLVQNKTPLIVDFIEFITADLTDESGNSVSKTVELLTLLPWQTSQDRVLPDPTKSEAVLSLAKLKIPVYPVSRGDRIQLQMMNHFDVTFASMLFLNKEEHHYIQKVLTPRMREYCAQLTMDKYNPPSGGYCLAYCRELKFWTRAHCVKSSEEHGHCYLFLVDYGVHAHIPISDLRPCHTLFTQYHSLAFIAHIPEFETTELSREEIMRKYATHEYTVIQVVNCDEQHTVDRVVLAL